MEQSISWDKRVLEFQEALRESQTLALAGQFSAATIHEINGPLEVIANLNYLLRINAEDSVRVRDYCRLVDEQLRILAGITRQTLSYCRSGAAAEATEVAPLVEAAVRVHYHKIAAKEIHLVKSLPGDIVFDAQPGAMLQVISNLIANALEALPSKGTLSLRARSSDNEVHIVVADDGHGIPPAIEGRIFEPFFSTKKAHGTGLGLAITKSIVERHCGRIRARTSTRSGRSGTAFRISLPLHASVGPMGE